MNELSSFMELKPKNELEKAIEESKSEWHMIEVKSQKLFFKKYYIGLFNSDFTRFNLFRSEEQKPRNYPNHWGISFSILSYIHEKYPACEIIQVRFKMTEKESMFSPSSPSEIIYKVSTERWLTHGIRDNLNKGKSELHSFLPFAYFEVLA